MAFTGGVFTRAKMCVDKALFFGNRAVDTWNTCDKRHADRLSLYQEPRFISAAPAAPVLTVVSSALVSQYLAYWQLLPFSNLLPPFLHNNLQDTKAHKTQHLVASCESNAVSHILENPWPPLE